jgi:hypothetical protein
VPRRDQGIPAVTVCVHEIQISAVTAPSKVFGARLAAVAYRGFSLRPRQGSVVKQLLDRLCSSEPNFTRVGR